MKRRASHSPQSADGRQEKRRAGSSSIDTDVPPTIRREPNLPISPIDSSLLRACLVAPTRKPSLSSQKEQSPKSQKLNGKSLGVSAACSSRIEKVVRDAYKDVKARRSSEREKLVRAVLDESLDGVIRSSEAGKHQTSAVDVNVGGGAHDRSEVTRPSRKKKKLFNQRTEKKKHKKTKLQDGERKGWYGDDASASPIKRRHKNGKDPIPTNTHHFSNGSHSRSGLKSSKMNGKLNGHTLNHSPSKQNRDDVQRLIFPRLPSNNCSIHSYFESPFSTIMPPSNDTFSLPQPCNLATDKKHSIKVYDPSTRTESSTKHQPLLIEGAHEPGPSSSSVIFLKSFFSAEDERNLAHVPYFGEENNEDFDWDLFDMEERMKLYEYGPPYCEKETIETIDEVLKLIKKKEPDWFKNVTVYVLDSDNEEDSEVSSSYTQTIKHVHAILAELTSVNVKRVQERHIVCFDAKTEDIKPKAKQPKSEHPSSPSRHHKKSDNDDTQSYHDAIGSYRDLFCRICFTYDCQVHGNIPKGDIQLLGEIALAKDYEGHWKEIDNGIPSDEKSDEEASEKEIQQTTIKSLSKERKAICERLFFIYQGDVKKIARVLNATVDSVDATISEQKIKLQPPEYVSAADTINKKRKGKAEYHSMKNYNSKWLANIQGCEIHPAFIPCDHLEPCSDKTCSCVKNKFFCNKACAWGSKSKNYFRGCACKAGQCRSSSCPCWAANRECDPDLCRTCGACTDPAEKLADKQRCRNDNISMRRHAHLLLAKSSINAAGWGLYTKHSLQKGSFVHEYVGEVITQEEAERRGIIYDKLNMSYLFNLSSDYTVDATRKGNKLRYANHSSNAPNCEAKMIRVNGDMRIGLFAKVDIEAQSELFFDYRYDETIDNELIIKPAHKFHWMKSPSRKDSKKPSGNKIPIKAAQKNAYK